MWLKILFLVFSSVLIECAEVWAERLCEHLELNNRTDFVSHNLTFDVSCNEGLAKFVRKEYPSAFEDVSFVLEPAVSRVKNHKCRRQLDSFLAALKNSSLWAVQMFDASSKIPQGLVSAETYQLGNYDECVEINLGRDVSDNVYGKYCLPYIQISPLPEKYPRYFEPNARNPLSLVYDTYASVWEKFLIPGITSRVRKDVYRSAVCVPNHCSPQDVQQVLTYLYNNVVNKYGFEVDVTIPDNVCSTNQTKETSMGAIILCRTILVAVLLVVVVSAWDLITRLPGSHSRLIGTFSIFRNFYKLSNTEKDDQFLAIHGMKVIFMVFIILGHRVYLTFGAPIINREQIDEVLQGSMSNVYVVMLNGPIFVDTFLLISGFLVCLRLHSEFVKNPNLKFRMIYLNRWLRMTPTYMLVVFFYAYMLEDMGNGPMWMERVGREAERCRESWWTNLLYINNYVNVDKICMIQSWYVTVDIHYILIAPFIIRQLVVSPRKGVMILLGLIAAAIAVPFYIIYSNRLNGVLKVDVDFLEDQIHDAFYTQVYIKSHTRALPYLMGIAAAYFYIKKKEQGKQFSNVQMYILDALTVMLAFVSYFIASLFFSSGRKYDAFENAAAGTFRRFFWAGSVAYVLVASSFDQLRLLHYILHRKIFVPLSRLSYPVLLVHSVIQMYINGILRTADYVSFPRMLWMTTADLAATYFFAFLLHLFFEAPAAALVRTITTKMFSVEVKPKKS